MTAKAFQIKLCRRSPIKSFPQSSNGFLQPRPLSYRKLLQVEHVGYGSKVASRSAAVVRTEMNAEERIAENRALHHCARPVSLQKPISSQVPVPRLPGFHVYSPSQSLSFDRQLTDLPSSAMRIPLDSLAQKARPWLPSGEGGAAMAV
jgi:hypothetical protein